MRNLSPEDQYEKEYEKAKIYVLTREVEMVYDYVLFRNFEVRFPGHHF